MTSAQWDDEAEHFDDQPDHGLLDPAVRTAWTELLRDVLPAPPGRIADVGCGTGTLSSLIAGLGHEVDAVDFSPAMVRRAQAKTAGLPVRVLVGDAARPPLADGGYDAVVCRHVLWALDDQVEVLRRWSRLLTPSGRLVLIEGNWSTGTGLTHAECLALLEAAGRRGDLTLLTDEVYWGRAIADDRYLVVA